MCVERLQAISMVDNDMVSEGVRRGSRVVPGMHVIINIRHYSDYSALPRRKDPRDRRMIRSCIVKIYAVMPRISILGNG
jgi:hypothetical protein